MDLEALKARTRHANENLVSTQAPAAKTEPTAEELQAKKITDTLLALVEKYADAGRSELAVPNLIIDGLDNLSITYEEAQTADVKDLADITRLIAGTVPWHVAQWCHKENLPVELRAVGPSDFRFYMFITWHD